MKITTLGTNGWFDSATGQTMCTLIQTDDYAVILDAGFGIQKIRGLVDFSKPVYLFLSHLHYDHTVGLHTLEMYDFAHPLTIIVPKGLKDLFLQMGRPPYSSDWMKAPRFPIHVFDTDELNEAALPFSLTAMTLRHPSPDMGFRMEIEGKSVVYLCDTTYCPNCVTLAQNADLVIADSGFLPGKANEKSPHMDPIMCANLAKEAQVKQMLLTHFSGYDYPTIASRKQAVDQARPIFKELITAVDDMEIIL